MSYDLIGALPAGTTPVWLRAVVTREGQDIVTRCCVVAEGQVMPIEVRVNVPALIATLRAMGLAPPVGQDGVAGFGSFLKKAVKSVTKSKIVKAVGKAVGKVVKNPVVQMMNPAAAIAIHTTAKAASGKGTIKGAAGKIVNLGTQASMAAAGPAAKLPSALSFVGPRASAALGLGMKAVQTARLGSTIASVAKTAQSQVNLGRAAAASLKAGKVTPAQALPLVKRAVALQANVKKIAPALARQVVLSSNVKKSFATIAAKAKAGSVEAKQASAVIAKSAQALDKILRLQAQAAGGLPGLLVTANGRVVKAPRGRFQLRTATTARPDILYRGAKEPTLKGLFSAVSGEDGFGFRVSGFGEEGFSELPASRFPLPAAVSGSPAWGGSDDPGNDIEGPMYPVQYEGGGWQLDDLSVSGRVIDTTGVGAMTP